MSGDLLKWMDWTWLITRKLRKLWQMHHIFRWVNNLNWLFLLKIGNNIQYRIYSKKFLLCLHQQNISLALTSLIFQQQRYYRSPFRNLHFGMSTDIKFIFKPDNQRCNQSIDSHLRVARKKYLIRFEWSDL